MDLAIYNQVVASEHAAQHWECFLPFNMNCDGGEAIYVDLLDYVVGGSMVDDNKTKEIAKQNNYPGHCLLQFPHVYSGDQMLDPLIKAINKSAEEEGFYLVRHKKK